jgi:hypothetical protein
MFFNLLTFSVPDVTLGCFSIFWLWSYLTLLQDVFQSFDFWACQVRWKSKDWKTSWGNVRCVQSQKIEKHPGVTSGTIKVKRLFFNLLTLSVPDVTSGFFSIFWLWAYLTLLQDAFQSFDFERTWRYSRMFFNLLTLSVPDVTPGCFSVFWLWKTSWSNVRYAQSQKI